MNESITRKKERERRRLKSLIKEYSELGYDISTELKGYPTPQEIEGIRPDLILKKANKMIIIEIASTQDLKTLSDKINILARYADERENVRFDIVLSNPNPRLTKKEKLISKDVLLGDIQNRLLLEAKKSYDEGFYRGSLMCLAVLLENLVRQKAIEKKAIKISEKTNIKKTLHLLRTNRIISEKNYKEINNFIKIRNKVVHQGYEPEERTINDLFSFVSVLSNPKTMKQFNAESTLDKRPGK